MFKRSLFPVWIGILILSGMFLMGQESWPPPITYPFSDTFENGLANWTVSGSDWGLTELKSRSATHSLTDSPSGNYPVSATYMATLANSIDLSAFTSPVLTFWNTYDIRGGDGAYVQVSSDGGTTWTNLIGPFAGTISTWYLMQFDLTPFKASEVKIRFYLYSNADATVGDGWYIDDVQIKENEPPTTPYPFSDTLENGLADWTVSGSDWGLTELKSRSATHSLTDSPSGNYPVSAALIATLANSIDLSASTSPVLTFWHSYDIRGGDGAYVQVSSDGGTTWTNLIGPFAGTISTWYLMQFDLTPYKASEVKIRFYLASNADATVGDGWYIDDVQIKENGL